MGRTPRGLDLDLPARHRHPVGHDDADIGMHGTMLTGMLKLLDSNNTQRFPLVVNGDGADFYGAPPSFLTGAFHCHTRSLFGIRITLIERVRVAPSHSR
jgi:hypothetical protein